MDVWADYWFSCQPWRQSQLSAQTKWRSRRKSKTWKHACGMNKLNRDNSSLYRHSIMIYSSRQQLLCMSTCSPFNWHGLALIPAWICNHIHYKMWDEINYPFLNFNGATVEVWEWISNFIPHITGHLITYPCWDLSYTMLVKVATGRNDANDTSRPRM